MLLTCSLFLQSICIVKLANTAIFITLVLLKQSQEIQKKYAAKLRFLCNTKMHCYNAISNKK